jgi:hypothetical protein
MSRLEIAINRSDKADDKRRWTAELNRLKKKDEEAKRQFNLQLGLEKEKLARSFSRASSGSSGGGGGGGSGYGSSGGGTNLISSVDSMFDSMWNKQPNAPRQTQDAWINAWFAQNGVTDPEDRQGVWDYINTTRKRPSEPWKDHLYKH